MALDEHGRISTQRDDRLSSMTTSELTELCLWHLDRFDAALSELERRKKMCEHVGLRP